MLTSVLKVGSYLFELVDREIQTDVLEVDLDTLSDVILHGDGT